MSSSLDVSTPITTANVSPISNNNNSSNGNNQKSNNSNNNGGQKFDAAFPGNETSPCNSDGNNSQSLDESNGNIKSKTKSSGGVPLSIMDLSSRGERDALHNSLLRQGSTSANSCTVQFNESSPNNGDSSNSSSIASHVNTDNNNKSNDEEKLNNQTTKNNTTIKDEERDKSNSSSTLSSSSSSNSSNTALPTQTSISNIKVGLSTGVVKDEKDMVKKEETSLSSPNLSPVGFGSIVGAQNNECNDISGSTSNKSNDSTSSCDKRAGLSINACNENDETSMTQSAAGLIVPGNNNLNIISSCNPLNSNTNPLNSKSSLDGFYSDGTASTTIVSSMQNTACNIPLSTSFIINNFANANGPPQGSSGGVGCGSNIVSGASSGINNCMEYMQQQNHIFVFSTQLANKGADAVLASQFPTIIAYHCTQPATKSFFEDFFLKNPMKMTKLQRQNSLNVIGGLPTGGVPGSGGQPPWLSSSCNPLGKLTHKLALNKSETLPSSSNSTGSVLSENDMMCWDPARSVMDNAPGDSTAAMKMLETAENSNNTGKNVCSKFSNDESCSIPSLQGVKVPDENLTPQQRQHREEQLAKLKKMNQFLFPENGGNDFHTQGAGNNSMMAGKLQVPPDSIGGNAVMSGNPVTLMGIQGPNIGTKLNVATGMRNISSNLLNNTKTDNICNTQHDNMSNMSDDIIMSTNIMAGSGCGPNEMNSLPAGLKQGCMQNMNNTAGIGGNGGRGLLNAAGSNLNLINNNSSMGIPPGGLINEPNNSMIGNTSDALSQFNANNCTSSGQDGGLNSAKVGSHKNLNAQLSHPSDMNSGLGISQLEWSKLHHYAYEERLKNNHSNANSMSTEIVSVSVSSSCQQTSTRSIFTGVAGGGGGGISHRTNSNANTNNRTNQGPPPPYHPTKRSASVPIATQSPNPSSPNNPTSNMSLPSPRTSNAMGSLSSTTSPSVDSTTASSSASTANTNSTTTTTAVGVSSGGNNSGSTNSKNTFSQQNSPTPGSGTVSSNRNRSSVNNLHSNPATPLSHISPKDIDPKNINVTTTSDHKSVRSNAQRSRSPLLNDVPNNAIESRFPSPGLNFVSNSTSGANPQNVSNSFKNQNSSIERQNLQQIPPQFCRRTDNMPLNPNSNRNQTKISNAFDPISSLAQMSQQLTSGGVGLNSGGVSNAPNNVSGLMGGPGGLSDINMNGLMSAQMMGGAFDSSVDHCNQNPNGGGNMTMPGLGTGAGSGPLPGPFGPGNCNMMGGNPGPICQRLLNPKICGPNISGGFNPNQVGGIGMRDGTSGFSGMMSSHRMINHRMSANFGNFNVSPNIQVKASTPNTIQYMPVRPQNNNTNSNIRVPPSLEFLQRYANPQIMGNSGPGACSSDMSVINGSDLNKMPNTQINNMGVGNPNAMNQMNFFGNANQMSGIGSIGQTVTGNDGSGGVSEQDEMQGCGVILNNHDPMNIQGPHAPMLRGMRPIMRQGGLQSGVGMNSGSRMQHPSVNNISHSNNMGGSTFPNNDGDSLDCNDPTNGNIFNNPVAAGLFPQQKSNKPPSIGMSHGPLNPNPNNSNNAQLANNSVINDQNSSSNSIQNSVMIGPNSSLLNSIPGSNTGGPGGPMPPTANMEYKSFVGPTANDLKYAQQYHSFQQQLYATSTRNQQPGGGQQQPNTIPPSSNTNAGFFVK